MGRDSGSSAQSKRGGGGIERGSTGLGWGSTRDGGRKTAAAEGPDMLVVVEDGAGGETARLRPSCCEVGVGTSCGGVLMSRVACSVALGLRSVVLSGAEQGIGPSSTMRWQSGWAFRGIQPGPGQRAGGNRAVWEVVEVVVGDGGAGAAVLSSG
jgi:hypothetical protein